LKGGRELFQDELAGHGSYKTGKGRLYIKTLKDIDPVVLGTICAKSCASVKQAYRSVRAGQQRWLIPGIYQG